MVRNLLFRLKNFHFIKWERSLLFSQLKNIEKKIMDGFRMAME
jgi:hypothetical protein